MKYYIVNEFNKDMTFGAFDFTHHFNSTKREIAYTLFQLYKKDGSEKGVPTSKYHLLGSSYFDPSFDTLCKIYEIELNEIK